MARLTETTYLENAPSVDDNILRDVVFLGPNSRNNRRYSEAAMQDAAPKYKGKKIYIDHARESGERSIDRWAGTIVNASFSEGKIRGDVKLRQKSPYFEGILEAVKDFPSDVGFSHVADGETRLDGQTEVVESIREVFSVDLVTDPATTGGFFESQDKPMTKTVKQILETADKRSKWAKVLVEMKGVGAVEPGMEVEVPEEADPAEEVKAALEKAAMAVLKKWFAGDIEESSAIAEIKKIAGMKDDAVSEEPETPATESDDMKAVKAELARLREDKALTDARNMLLEASIEPTDARVKVLARTPKDEQRELIESWPAHEANLTDRPAYSPARVVTDEANESTIKGAFARLSR